MKESTPRPLHQRVIATLAILIASLSLVAALQATSAEAAAFPRVSYVKAGDYRTLATLWNTNAAAEFVCPAGAKIRVRYGGGWFAKNRQEQTLNCTTPKRLSVGKWSVLVARMQIKVPTSQNVQWAYIVEGPS